MTHCSEISTIQALEAFLKRRLLNGASLHHRGSLDLGSLSFIFIFMLDAITTRVYIYIYRTCICIKYYVRWKEESLEVSANVSCIMCVGVGGVSKLDIN